MGGMLSRNEKMKFMMMTIGIELSCHSMYGIDGRNCAFAHVLDITRAILERWRPPKVHITGYE